MFEVCGGETVSLNTNGQGFGEIHKYLPQYDCKQYICAENYMDFKGNFTTTSRLCSANRYKLYEKDVFGNYVEHRGGMVTLDPVDQTLYIKTHYNYTE